MIRNTFAAFLFVLFSFFTNGFAAAEKDTELEPAFKENNVAVCLCCDDKFALYAGVAIQSIIANSSDKNNYDIVIFGNKISQKKKDMVSGLIKGFDNFSIRFIDIDKELAKYKESFFIRLYYSVDIYSRLFIFKIFSSFDRVLYLDSDLVVNRDVADLFNVDIGDKVVAACSCWNTINGALHKRGIGMSKDPSSYFNSGVIVFDLKKTRGEDIFGKCIAVLNEKSSAIKYPDQDALSVVFDGRTLILDQRWNFFEDKPFDSPPYIIHFTGKHKPWIDPTLRKTGTFFLKYAEMTPFCDTIESETRVDRIIYFVKYFPRRVGRFIKRTYCAIVGDMLQSPSCS
ncbi:MAG: glycosyltransferase family 8 protein [Holosporales bacterium]|jgi:lipopolysaccharide biosynthesis glycosyltransferase|nr:glycosyltransferase family 8 protein [Holosporales bacterium]